MVQPCRTESKMIEQWCKIFALTWLLLPKMRLSVLLQEMEHLSSVLTRENFFCVCDFRVSKSKVCKILEQKWHDSCGSTNQIPNPSPSPPSLCRCLISKAEVQGFIERCMVAVGTKPHHARSLAEVLVEGDHRGHYSHGLNRMGGWSHWDRSFCCMFGEFYCSKSGWFVVY